uniref:Uncharacterized protein n=1 Tax=Rangifer tarandus platyrhynchus TaxID=3082113 RepID=A0ACB0DQH6_RANTA|nr:unnamed protein product [Rangifer tarandus platyrhynchus]
MSGSLLEEGPKGCASAVLTAAIRTQHDRWDQALAAKSGPSKPLPLCSGINWLLINAVPSAKCALTAQPQEERRLPHPGHGVCSTRLSGGRKKLRCKCHEPSAPPRQTPARTARREPTAFPGSMGRGQGGRELALLTALGGHHAGTGDSAPSSCVTGGGHRSGQGTPRASPGRTRQTLTTQRKNGSPSEAKLGHILKNDEGPATTLGVERLTFKQGGPLEERKLNSNEADTLRPEDRLHCNQETGSKSGPNCCSELYWPSPPPSCVPKASGPCPALGSALPKGQIHPPSLQGCDKCPTQQGPP